MADKYGTRTPQEVARELETRFQNGGPKVYTVAIPYDKITPSQLSATKTARLASPEESVWNRSKKGPVYQFREFCPAKTEVA